MELFVFTIVSLILLEYKIQCYPAGSQGSLPILKPFGGAVDNVEHVIKNIAKSKTITPNFPNSGRTRAVLELETKESFPNQLDNKYGRVQDVVATIFKPQPIVDTTREHEKNGNDAAGGRKVANLIVGGFEGVSNILNAIAEAPFVATYQFGRTLTGSLNTVGGKLVGLS